MTDALIRVRLEGDEAVAGADRISQALGRIERGEPTRALRATRMAVDELATAATGLHPVMGRLVATFAEFGIGGAVGLASVAGLAAIGLEMKYLIGYADALDAKLLKLNITLAATVPSAGRLLAASAADQKAEDLSHPGLFSWEAMASRPDAIGAVLRFTGLGAASATGRESERATALTTAGLQRQDIEDKRNASVQKEIDALDQAALAHDRAALGVGATARQIELLARQADELRLRTVVLDPAERGRIENLLAETRALDRQAAAVVARDAQRRRDFPFQNVTYDPNDIYNDARARNDPNQPTTPGISRGEQDAIDYRNRMLPGGGGGAEPAAAVTGDKIGLAVTRTLAASLPSLVGALSRGDAGGFLSAAGAGIEGLSNLKGLSAAGPIGLVLSTIGGLFSLFSGGGAKVSVETISDRAAKQLRDAQGVPQNVTLYLVDERGNVTQVMSKIQHEERKDASKRFAA